MVPRGAKDLEGCSLGVSRRRFLQAGAATSLAAACASAEAKEPSEPSLAPRPVRPVTPLDGRLTAVIPARLQPKCEKLMEAIRRRGGRIGNEAASAESHRGHVLLVGALESNRWIRHLYLRSWLATDVLHPGRGGYELKTLCGALDPEANVVLIGAADPAGLAQGIEQFLRRIEGDDVIPCLFEARPSSAVVEASKRCEAWIAPEGFAPYRGTWDGLRYMASLGAYAAHTCRRDFLEAFKRECLAQLRMGPRDGYHAYFGRFILFFRMLEHLDCWDDAERSEVVRRILEIMRSSEGVAYIRGWAKESNVPRQNHQTRAALSAFYVADYFQRFFGLPDSVEWLDVVERFFRPQLSSIKPIEDTSGHQWKASLHNVAAYAMASGKGEFFSGGHFRASVLRALQNMSNLGQQAVVAGPGAIGWAPWTVFGMAAVMENDPSFLAYARRWYPGLEVLLEPRLCGDEPFRSFAVSEMAKEPQPLIGVYVSPLARLFYEGSDRYTPGFFGPKPPFEKTFDKISFRSGFALTDDYILLDGVSGGSHSYEDAGALKEIDLLGHPWVCAIDAGYREACIAAQNGVLVLRNGQRTAMPQYAELLDASGGRDAGRCRIRLGPYSGAVWTRHVYWRAGKYVAVVDHVEAAEEGEFQVEVRWQLLGHSQLAESRVTSSFPQGAAGPATFALKWHAADAILADRVDFSHELFQYEALQNERERPLFACDKVPGLVLRLRLVRRARLRPGQWLAVGSLMYAWEASAPDPQWEIGRSEQRWRVQDASGEHEVLPGAEGDARKEASEDESSRRATPAAPIRSARPKPRWWRPRSAPVCRWDGGFAVGFENGDVRAYSQAGAPLWRAKMEAPIHALCTREDGGLKWVAAAGDDGALSVFEPNGKVRWSAKTSHHFVEASALTWAHYRPTIRRIGVLPSHGGKGALLLAGLGDGYLHALDPASGNEVWQYRLQWGLCSVLEVGDVDNDGDPEIILGAGQPSIHSQLAILARSGKLIRHLARPCDNNWGMATEATALTLCDLDGDGCPEILHGTANHVGQLACWRGDGRLLWDVDVGERVTHLAADRSAGVHAVSRSGWIFALSPDGRIRARAILPAPAVAWSATPGRIVMAVESGELFDLAPTGLRPLGASPKKPHALILCGAKMMIVGRDGEIRPFPV